MINIKNLKISLSRTSEKINKKLNRRKLLGTQLCMQFEWHLHAVTVVRSLLLLIFLVFTHVMRHVSVQNNGKCRSVHQHGRGDVT